MAHAAPGLPATLDGAALLLSLAGRRHLGRGQPATAGRGARGRGPRGRPVGRYHRQSERKNHGKRRYPGASTPERKSRAASVTSSPTPAACWSRSWSTAPRSRTATARRRCSPPSPATFPRLRHVFADGAYAGPKLEGALKRIGRWSLEIVNRPAGVKGFQLLPRRWVVERTLAWLNRNRRLAKDFETAIETAEAWIFLASIQLLTRRLARA